MSDEESVAVDASEAQILTAEYKDGQLQIVEVTPFERDKNSSILPDNVEERKYMQVLDPSKGLVQLDLLNLTLVRCDDGEESYRLVTNAESDGGEISSDTVTCVLQSSDGEDHEQESYVMVEGSGSAPLVLLRSARGAASSSVSASASAPSASRHSVVEAEDEPKAKQAKQTNVKPAELLEKMKALQRARAIVSSQSVRPGRRGRRKAGSLPPPQELLASPGFRLYLYSCKMCSYKCNAIKELQAHRAAEHEGRNSGAARGGRGAGGGGLHSRQALATLQCARCPHRADTHHMLTKHLQTVHGEGTRVTNKVSLDSKEVEEADVLVCGACGFESGDRPVFKLHIEQEHGATTD